REVVVGRDEVGAFAGEGVQVERGGGGEGLPFAGGELGHAPAVQHHPGDHLHVVVPLAEGALGRLPHAGERLRQDRVQLFFQGGVGGLDARLHGGDLGGL